MLSLLGFQDVLKIFKVVMCLMRGEFLIISHQAALILGEIFGS